jgi:hypothetical protein
MDKLKKCEEYNIENDFLEQSLNWCTFKKTLKKIPENFKPEDLKEIYDFKFPKIYE